MANGAGETREIVEQVVLTNQKHAVWSMSYKFMLITLKC